MNRLTMESPGGIEGHPAAFAWRSINPNAIPRRIDDIKHKGRGKRVCRLLGSGAEGENVIAKYCSLRAATVEQAVYRLAPPRIMPRFYGIVPAAVDAGKAWLFVEELSGEQYDPSSAEHRRAAIQWLAALHATRDDGAGSGLPDRGPAHFARVLERTRRSLVQAGSLSNRDTVLERTISSLDTFSTRWTGIEAICAAAPSGLVHGDFGSKNVRILPSAAGARLLAFDWGHTSGMGSPAIDLASFSGCQADLRVYAGCRTDWSGCTVEGLQRLARVGRMFRLIDAIRWATAGVRRGSRRAPRNLAVYADEIEHVVAGS